MPLYQLELKQTSQAKLHNAKLSSDQSDKVASAAHKELKEASMSSDTSSQASKNRPVLQRTTSESQRRP